VRTTKASFANPKRPNLLAFLIYLDLAIGLFGLRVLASPANSYLGFPQDPGVAIWCLEWWPRAILHGQNPFYSYAVWAPLGFDLTWMTSIPGLSLLASPITLTFGPVVAYNLLALAAPALASWTAYILCRHITTTTHVADSLARLRSAPPSGAFWPSLFGGWVYGFSTYELNHVLGGHLCLSWVLVPPLCVYLVLLLVQRAISPRRFTLSFGAALIFQFSISHEVFAIMTIFGAFALLLAALLIFEIRSQLYRATLLIGCAYAVTAIAVSPFLYYFFFVHGVSREPIYPPALFSTDLLAAIIPGPLTFISRASREVPSGWENGAYLGPALVTLIGSFALRSWHQRTAQLLLIMLGLIYLTSLGPRLYIADHPTIFLPWSLVSSRLPLLNNALPARFMLFAWLVSAVIAAMWLAWIDVAIRAKIALALLSVVFLFPHPLLLWQAKTEIDAPPFFSDGLYRHYLRSNENILIIPYSRNGDSMLWQAQARMGFRMAGGWTGAAPQDFLRWPIVNALYSSSLMPDYGDQFKAFLAKYNVEAVVVSDPTKAPWPELVGTLAVKPIECGGVALYIVPSEIPARYRNTSVLEMERKADAAWFAELLIAADSYLARGLEVKDLNPSKAAQLGLLPAGIWAEDLDALVIRRRIGGPMLWLGPWDGNKVAIALAGSYPAIKPLIEHYRANALTIYFPYPDKLADTHRFGDASEILLMVFGREGLIGAAQQAFHQTTLESTAASSDRDSVVEQMMHWSSALTCPADALHCPPKLHRVARRRLR